MEYSVQYFRKKFEAIPEEQFCVGAYENLIGQKCVMGHCGVTVSNDSSEARTLHELFKLKLGTIPSYVNDAFPHPSLNGSFLCPMEVTELGDTPRERILTALELIEAGVSIE